MRIERVIRVRASRQQVVQAIRLLPAIASGSRGGAGPMAQALQVRIGLAALSKIKEAFIVKSRGGTDEAGERWRPLSPHTIAYHRRHPGMPRRERMTREGARSKGQLRKFAPSWMLTKQQRERWWALYSRFLGRYKGDKRHAAAVAWLILKGEGAKTLIGTYGSQQVDILRDTGLLFNSLSPGVLVGEQTPPVPPPRPEHQVFGLGTGQVIVGTNRKWAAAHHRGVPGKIPQRRLWPPVARWPSSWWNLIAEQAVLGVVDICAHLFGR